jgi:hypothetical protein
MSIEQELALLDNIVQKNDINAIKMLIDTKNKSNIEQIATVLCNFLLPYKNDLKSHLSAEIDKYNLLMMFSGGKEQPITVNDDILSQITDI